MRRWHHSSAVWQMDTMCASLRTAKQVQVGMGHVRCMGRCQLPPCMWCVHSIITGLLKMMALFKTYLRIACTLKMFAQSPILLPCLSHAVPAGKTFTMQGPPEHPGGSMPPTGPPGQPLAHCTRHQPYTHIEESTCCVSSLSRALSCLLRARFGCFKCHTSASFC